jgi:hypothetical protein
MLLGKQWGLVLGQKFLLTNDLLNGFIAFCNEINGALFDSLPHWTTCGGSLWAPHPAASHGIESPACVEVAQASRP